MAIDITQGPFTVLTNYGQVLEGIEDVTFNQSEDTTDISTIQGQKITIFKANSFSVVLKFVDTSIVNIKKIVPSAWIANGALINGQSAGNVVNNTAGAIALGQAGSDEDVLLTPLQFVPDTGAGEGTITLFDGRARLTSLTIEDQVVKAEVTVTSEAVGVQALKGAVTLVS